MKAWKIMVGAACVLGVSLLLIFAVGRQLSRKADQPAQGPSAENGVEGDAENSAEEPIADPTAGKTVTMSEISAMDVMCAPNGIAGTSDGAILVTDTFYKRLWRVQEGASEIYAGADTASDMYGVPVGGYNDADPLASQFKHPWGVVEFLDGWAVADTENNVVRIVRDKIVKTINGRTEGEANAADAGAAFNRPTGLATDDAGNLYISDSGNGTVRKVNVKGGITTEAEGLQEPMGLCWKDGALYIAESGAAQIVKLEDGKISIVAGSGEEGDTDGPALEASFDCPRDVAVGDNGEIYVADMLNSAIRRIWNGQVETVVSRDTALTQSGLVSPSGLLLQGDRLFICDNFSRKLLVLEWK